MTLCAGTTGCGCAIQSTSLAVTGSGTGADPWTIDLLGGAFLGNFYNFASTAERTTQLPIPAEGDVSFIRNLDRYQWYDSDRATWVDLVGDAVSWSPALHTNSLDPSNGSTGTETGWYTRMGDFVYAQFVITFGGTGIVQGSGTYNISLPLPPKSISGSSRIQRGMVNIMDATGPVGRDFGAILSATAIELRSLNSTFAAQASITEANIGITFAAGDQISGQVAYHAS
jgi:hypothetical protein